MKFIGKLRGENDIEATMQRLDRLTLDEGRATAAQTLEVVYGLFQHGRTIMDSEYSLCSSFSLLLNVRVHSDADGAESASVTTHALGMLPINF